ncbi:hypothetical protein GDO78_011903 [Eleutherodactylus coqui]|uniref:Uncharacterized protein n=1 Tax=Eleutherodactylus coqui TaxID=57060 RepID=A0A8J6F273_ELECQ|nr:hypothetical protein GDO78_011903 [Eleutherodactylus coqui]
MWPISHARYIVYYRQASCGRYAMPSRIHCILQTGDVWPISHAGYIVYYRQPTCGRYLMPDTLFTTDR